MALKKATEESYINSIVGPGTFFRGHVELSGLLRIDGDFSGSVITDGRVIVGREGRADCAIEAGSVVVGGLFKGEILAHEKIVLLASSVVIGSITTPRLIVEEGVLLSGRINVIGLGVSVLDHQAANINRKELLIETVRRRETSRAVTGERGHKTAFPELAAVQNERRQVPVGEGESS